jgi:Calpain family cysteine protease
LDGGNLSDALVDFTSGISETINIKDLKLSSDEQKRHEFFKTLLKQKENHALMCCAVAV